MVLTSSSDRSTATPVSLVPLDRRDDHVIAVTAPPAPLTSFIGRERELASLGALLRRGDVRLVTLTGPGGIGKTRLALRAADDLRGDPSDGSGQVFRDGIAFVELAAIRNPDLVLEAVAQALGVRHANDQAAGIRLARALRSSRLLIVLDNVEQVLGAAPALAGLLAACPHLTILATSRALLRISGEHDVPVPPLALPEHETSVPTSEIAMCDAVQLFAARAQAVRKHFSVDGRTMPVVAAICRRLDGLPLAIELAAARMRYLPPEGLLARLDRALPLLTGGSRDLPARLQTMRNAISWDYQLLTPAEQSLFCRLAVFVGGVSLDAAEYVGGEAGRREGGKEMDRPSSPPDVLDVVAALVEKSLLYPKAPGRDEDAANPRFGMLETIREFALDQLSASGELAAAQAACAAWCLAFAERAEPPLTDPDQDRWLARVDSEHPNLRAALGWLAVHGPHEQTLRLAAALSRFWEDRGHWSEGRRWIEHALAAAGESPELASARARALTGAGRLALLQDDEERAAVCHEQSLALYRAVADRSGIALALTNVGFLAYRRGDALRAEGLYDESLALCRALGDRHGIAFALDSLGVIANLRGDQESAVDLFGKSLALSRELSDHRQIAVTLANLGIVATHQANYARAVQSFEESLALARATGNDRLVAVALSYLGLIAQERGDTHRAVTLYTESLSRCRDREGHPPGPRCLAGLAAVAQDWGSLERAARLFGATEALRKGTGSIMWPAEQIINDRNIAATRKKLGAASFAAAWHAGRMLRLDQIVAEALAVAADAPSVTPGNTPEATAGLTSREVDVLRLLVSGRSNPQIADALFIGRGTVRTHVSNILGKLGVASRTAAAHVAYQRGLI